MQANLTGSSGLQSKIDDDRQRTDFTLQLRAPVPQVFDPMKRFLRNFVERGGEKDAFTFNVLQGATVPVVDKHGKLTSGDLPFPVPKVLSTVGAVEFKNIPLDAKDAIETAAEVLVASWERHGHKYTLDTTQAYLGMARQSERPTWKAATIMCQGCDKYEHGWGPGCVAVSYLWGDWERNRDYVNRYRNHVSAEENEAMRRGTRMHDLLVMMRNPIENIDEFLDRLVTGERISWMIPICAPKYGLRARPPDWVVSQLHRDGEDYRLVHYVVEDKASANPTYWNQVWGEVIILSNRNVLLHRYSSGHKRDEFQSTPGVPLIEALERKLGIDMDEWRRKHSIEVVRPAIPLSEALKSIAPEPNEPLPIDTHVVLKYLTEEERHTVITKWPISVDVYAAINVYTMEGRKRLKNPRFPIDNYSWLMGGIKPPDVEYPMLWSRDGRVRDLQLQERVLGIRRQRIEAYERGTALPPKRVAKRLQYRFTASHRTDLDNLTPLDEDVSMFTTKTKK